MPVYLILFGLFLIYLLKKNFMSDKEMRSNPKEKPENLEGFTS